MQHPRPAIASNHRILERLTALHPKAIDLSLGRMWRLLHRLGDPQDRLPPVFHVAGTNGKGSVVAYLRAIIEASGGSVHAYTSPHLVHFNERILIAGAVISDDYLADVLARCELANAEEPITFFEITTAAAFLAFAEVPADAVLLETGLGGRLDATNVIARPQATAITPISIDHTQYLGVTIEQIAAEKAGILRADVSCVVSRQTAAVDAVLEHAAAGVGAPLLKQGDGWSAEPDGPHLVFTDSAGTLRLPRPGLAGRHQIDNAGTALALLRRFAPVPLDAVAFGAGLVGVEWPARIQRITDGPLKSLAPAGADILLDGGHNAAAGVALARTMRDFAASDTEQRPLCLVVGMLNTKDPAGFLEPFRDLAVAIAAITIPDEPAALEAAAIAAAGAGLGLPIKTAHSLPAAITQLSDGLPGPRILICGSLYLAGAVLADIS